MSKTVAREKIDRHFSGVRDAKSNRKIKVLAMKNRIRLGKLKSNFCKKCYANLEGKTRVSKSLKTIECKNCGFVNKIKIS